MKPASPIDSPVSSKPEPTTLLVKRLTWGLALLVFALYLPVAGFQFLSYDDYVYITTNPHVRGGLGLNNIIWAFTTTVNSNYWHPITWLSHMLDCDLFGMNAGGHHLTNAILHAINTALLFRVLLRMTQCPWRSAFVAALFGVHPLHVESVAWISERKDVLSTLFWFLTMWAYARYVEMERAGQVQEPGQKKASTWYGLSLVFYVLGLMSKPMLVTLPFALLLLDYWPLRRFGFAVASPAVVAPAVRRGKPAKKGKTTMPAVSAQPSDSPPGWRTAIGGLVVEKIPFLLLAVGFAWLAFQTQTSGGALQTTDLLPMRYRMANALIVYVKYLAKTVWPTSLSFYYPHPEASVSFALAALAGAGLLGITAFAVLRGRKSPYVPVGWFWYLGTLLPVIGLIQIGSFEMADRYMYIPLTGIFVIITWGACELGLSRRSNAASVVPKRPIVVLFTVLGVAAVLCCAARTWQQSRFWKDGVALAEHALQLNPVNPMALNTLGETLLLMGRRDEAIAHFEQALTLKRSSDSGHFNLGLALLNAKRLDEAAAHLTEAIRLNPRIPKAHYNLGVYLDTKGMGQEAMALYRAELLINPDYAMAHVNLGNALVRQGNFTQAETHYHAAIRLEPNLLEAHFNLAGLLAHAGQTQAAIQEYNEALRIKPDMAVAHKNLATLCQRAGQYDVAEAHFVQALLANADDADAHYGLAWVLAATGKERDAEAHLQEAVRLRPDMVEAQNLQAWLLATSAADDIRNGKVAVTLARRVCEATGNSHPVALDTLSMALAETGAFAEAADVATQALVRAQKTGDHLLVDQIQKHAALYRENLPSRASIMEHPPRLELVTP